MIIPRKKAAEPSAPRSPDVLTLSSSAGWDFCSGSEESALKVSAVYRGINFSAETISVMPFYIMDGFITHHIGKGKKYFQLVFYPKLKASPMAESYETRGDNLNFVADKISFRWESPACRKYKIIKDFATEDDAKAYRDALFAGTAVVPGLEQAKLHLQFKSLKVHG